MNQEVGQRIIQGVSQSVNKPGSPSIDESMSQSVSQSVYREVNKLINQSITNQSDIRTTNQSPRKKNNATNFEAFAPTQILFSTQSDLIFGLISGVLQTEPFSLPDSFPRRFLSYTKWFLPYTDRVLFCLIRFLLFVE